MFPFYVLCSALSSSDVQGLSTTPKSLKHFGLVTESGCGTLKVGGGVKEKAGMLRGPKGCACLGEDSMAGLMKLGTFLVGKDLVLFSEK